MKLTNAELRATISDAAELKKGTEFFTRGGLHHLARYESRLSAEAEGSGASPYRVQVDLEKLDRGRCSCMAARTRPFCKHSAALLVAWVTQPDAFAVAAAAPPSDEAKRATVKKGKVDPNAMMRNGAAQIRELVGELAAGGIASVGPDRAESVRALAEPLRTQRLRRLSARTIQLASMLQKAATVDPIAWTDLLSDLLLAARRIEKHLDGDALEDRYLEELVGKTWTKKDRAPVAALRLVEVSWRTTVTPDDFRIVESRFVDLDRGEHYSEKQILPMMIARQREPKRSWAGSMVFVASAGRYPGFAPLRLDMEVIEPQPLLPEHLDALLAIALPRVGAALAAFQERRKDVFAPDLLPVCVRADSVLAGRAALQLVDPEGDALFLPADRELSRRIAEALREAELRAVIGDITIEGALPTIVPLSLVVQTAAGLELRPIVRSNAAGVAPRKWVDVARATGLSRGAVALGETREELAHAVVAGMVGFGPRAAEPIAQRLRDLGLARPADVLLAAANKPDPRERFDEVVKIHQVTGIALVRLAGAVAVDRDKLDTVPTWPCVRVPKTTERPDPAEIARRLIAGEADRFQAAVWSERWYAGLPIEAFDDEALWWDAAAAPWVVRMLGRDPTRAAALAQRVLRAEARDAFGVGILTALRLGAVDVSGKNAVRRAWAERIAGREPAPALAAREKLAASRQDERVEGARELALHGDLGAIPLLRATLEADPGAKVREACAIALGQLGDLEIADWLLTQLTAGDEVSGRAAIRALALLRDRRALGPLWALCEAGKYPQLVPEALLAFGAAARDAGWAALRANPDLAKRAPVRAILLGADPVATVLAHLEPALYDACLTLVWDLDAPRGSTKRPRAIVAAKLLEVLPADSPLRKRCARGLKE